MTTPPVAARRRHSITHHGITIEDPYAWLRDPNYPEVDDPEILAHLEAENAWFEAAMAPHRPLVDMLYEEMKARIKEDESSVPQKDGDWLYWTAYETGGQYRKWWRKPVLSDVEGPVLSDVEGPVLSDVEGPVLSNVEGPVLSTVEGPVAGGADELILDEPALAEGKEYFRVGAIAISEDGRVMAYSTDEDGSERYTIRFKSLTGAEQLDEVIAGVAGKWGDTSIEGTIGNIVWTSDGRGLLYGLTDEHWRTRTIKHHRIGTPASDDTIVYYEEDVGYSVGVEMTSDRRWIALVASGHDTSEIRLYPAADPSADPILVAPRKQGREYDLDTHGDTLFITTNDTDPMFRLCTADIAAPGEWRELIAPSPHFYLTGVECYRDFFVVEGREDGLDQVAIHRYDSPTQGERIAFPEASYAAGLGDNPEYDQTVLRLGYESMVTPGTVYDYDTATGERTVLKVQEIPAGYDPAKYRTERLRITARDGTLIPVSIVYPTDFPRDGSRPLFLYAYGAYGHAIPPGFSTGRLSFLDRGFAYAIAHIRGGDDLGQQWYHDGKLEKRTNTFNDFVDVARGLIADCWTAEGRIATAGRSAGGELMGAIVNSDPELWGAVIADVPFVDVLNTMLDADLPLTPGEWPEWGNPIEDAAAFELIRSYSPYDNVRAQAYPPMFISGGLNDPRVTYWEPAKWAAKLRATKTDDNVLLLKTNMGAGHGGKSGRFDSLREAAEENAFVLWQLGIER